MNDQDWQARARSLYAQCCDKHSYDAADAILAFAQEYSAEARAEVERLNGKIAQLHGDYAEELADLRAQLAAATPAVKVPPMNDGELWSWVRSVLSQGASIQQDYMHNNIYPTYEHYSARLDCAAIERADELTARLAQNGAVALAHSERPTDEG